MIYDYYRESAGCDVIELVHTVEVPTVACKYPFCLYKYCVYSDAVKEFMKSPFEFITGNTRSGGIINRSLSLDVQFIQRGSE